MKYTMCFKCRAVISKLCMRRAYYRHKHVDTGGKRYPCVWCGVKTNDTVLGHPGIRCL